MEGCLHTSLLKLDRPEIGGTCRPRSNAVRHAGLQASDRAFGRKAFVSTFCRLGLTAGGDAFEQLSVLFLDVE